MILFCWADTRSGKRKRMAKKRCSALLLLAEKALNFFEVLIFTGQTDVRRKRHSPLSINDKRRGKRFHAAVELADRIVAQQNTIIHLVCGDVWLDGVPAILIHRDAHDGESLGFVLLLEFDEPGNFKGAGAAPGGPKVEQDDFAAIIGQFYGGAVGIVESEIGGRFAVSDRLRLGIERLSTRAGPEQGRNRQRHE
jgi:hypothetical protein